MTGRPVRRLDAAALWEYALRILAGRAHSAGEVRQKLRRKAEAAADVETVIARLREYGYVDDRKFAAMTAAARVESRGYGRARVLRELRERRVAPGIAGQAVEKAFEGVDEIELIEAYLARKYRKVALGEFLGDQKNLASAYRRLRTAGFSTGNAIRVLKRHAREAEMLDTLEADEPDTEAGPRE